MLFRILVVAKGYTPTFFGKTDPVKGALEARLKRRATEGIPEKNILLGKVVNAKKEPMAQAVVSVQMTQVGNTGMGSPPPGTDPIAITDEEGNFALYSEEPFDHMTLKVEARAMAPLRFNEVRPGPTRRELVVTEGAGLRGRVVLNGKPMKDIAVGVVSVDRSDDFTGDFEYASNEEGVFYFPNLPPNRPYYVYGMTSSTMAHGAIPAKQLKLKGDGEILDIGDLEIVPGRRLAGQVKLADGKPLPKPTRLTVGRREAWDSYTVELNEDGSFDLTNMPPESISVAARVSGYRHSRRNKSLDRLNPFSLQGMLTKDKSDLVVLLEPGERLESEWLMEPEDQRAENLPIEGIEYGGAVEKILRGRILDAATGEPIQVKAQITPGYSRDPQGRFKQWLTSRSVTAENGSYEMALPHSRKDILVQVLAEDYAPHMSKSIALASTNQEYNLTLTRAKSPSAALVGVDGKPAAGVKVYLLGAMEQGSLNRQGELNVFSRGGPEAVAVTDTEGRFKLAPKAGEAEIFAATKEGFARVPVKDLEEKIALQRYGKVRGRLMKDGKPAAEEAVDLGTEWAFSQDRPHLNLHGTVTDENGYFEIAMVPPGKMKVTRREKFGPGGGWTNIEIKGFEAHPGETVDLGEVEYPAGQLSRRPGFFR
mgnify:CR=1 FL=1